MAWVFDAQNGDLAWRISVSTIVVQDNGILDLNQGGDLSVDTGDRTNDISVLDQGLRVI